MVHHFPKKLLGIVRMKAWGTCFINLSLVVKGTVMTQGKALATSALYLKRTSQY